MSTLLGDFNGVTLGVFSSGFEDPLDENPQEGTTRGISTSGSRLILTGPAILADSGRFRSKVRYC